MKFLLFAIGLMVVTSVLADDAVAVTASVTDNDGLLTVSYSLTEKSVVTFDATTNGAPIDASCFKSASGDVWKLMPAGEGSFTWRPANDIPQFNVQGADLKVRVKAWSVDAPPDYMVVNLATSDSVPVAVNYYECEEQLPGKITDPVYKTAKLVMRKIPAANVQWRMGSPTGEVGRGGKSGMKETTHYVTLTEDYYLGVYIYTKGQRAWVENTPDNVNKMTAEVIDQYSNVRGWSKYWPNDGHVLVDSDNRLLQKIRRYTGIDFDLPTEAQWEFAARAGEKAAIYTGKNLSNATACDEAGEVAWYKDNSPVEIKEWMGYPEVGLKKPNAYGLYDMLGIAWELCLDRYQDDLGSTAVTNPKGPTTGDYNVKRGGSLDCDANCCRCSARSRTSGYWAYADPWTKNCNTAVRLWAPAKAVK